MLHNSPINTLGFLKKLKTKHAPPQNFKIQIENFTFYETRENVVRIEIVVFTRLTKVT